MTKRPTTEELQLVVRRGSGAVERFLTVVEPAKRQERFDDPMELTEGR